MKIPTGAPPRMVENKFLLLDTTVGYTRELLRASYQVRTPGGFA